MSAARVTSWADAESSEEEEDDNVNEEIPDNIPSSSDNITVKIEQDIRDNDSSSGFKKNLNFANGQRDNNLRPPHDNKNYNNRNNNNNHDRGKNDMNRGNRNNNNQINGGNQYNHGNNIQYARGNNPNHNRGNDRERDRNNLNNQSTIQNVRKDIPSSESSSPPKRSMVTLLPRTLPIEDVGKVVSTAGIFGGGKPRDELAFKVRHNDNIILSMINIVFSIVVIIDGREEEKRYC